jgi:hypothetical protein
LSSIFFLITFLKNKSISFSFILSSFSFSYFSFLLIVSNQNKKNKEKGIGIPSMMCKTNDDVIRNGNKHNNVMKTIKCLKKKKGKKIDEKVVTIEENKKQKMKKN